MGEPKPTVEEQAADWVIRLGEGELDARITKSKVVGQFGQRSEDTPYHQAALCGRLSPGRTGAGQG